MSTTVGYERRANAILSEVDSAEGFVRECVRLDNLPAVPPYWRRMRSRNLRGVEPLGVLSEPPALSVDAVEQHRGSGAIVLDTRSPEAFGGAHLPGALNVGLGTAFSTWAGHSGSAGCAGTAGGRPARRRGEVTWQLLRIGYPLPLGWLTGGVTSWRVAAKDVEATPQITVDELHGRLSRDELTLLDVRQPSEWAGGHAPGATYITGAELPERLDECQQQTRGGDLRQRLSLVGGLQPAGSTRTHRRPQRHGRHDSMETGRTSD